MDGKRWKWDGIIIKFSWYNHHNFHIILTQNGWVAPDSDPPPELSEPPPAWWPPLCSRPISPSPPRWDETGPCLRGWWDDGDGIWMRCGWDEMWMRYGWDDEDGMWMRGGWDHHHIISSPCQYWESSCNALKITNGCTMSKMSTTTTLTQSACFTPNQSMAEAMVTRMGWECGENVVIMGWECGENVVRMWS